MERCYFDLNGRIAVITGGGTGIGKSIAAGLAEAGATVVLCGRRLHKCEEACREIGTKTGSEAYACQCDVTDKKQIEGLVRDTVNRFGHIHILVNNAGVASNYHALDLPEEEWDRVLDTNLKGCFLFSQAVGRIMAARKSGAIVNIGSQLGDVARPNRVHYSTSKGGIKILTKALAVDLASYGIRVNAVAPGPVETEMAKPALSDPDLKSKILDHIPLGRVGQTHDIRGAVVFLVSDAASYITGVTLHVDGGYLAV
jgi:NAD(P)-dependent dehydrogenase (short-subunit alcohol dehydrogenase family)